jgi:pimeloyl-ACP methyl ester carboxylesterase
MPFLDLIGRAIEYVRIGTAREQSRPLVFLHEGLGSIEQWRDFPARMAERAGTEAVVYNRAGHGRSGPVSSPRSVRFMHDEALRVLPALLERLAIDRSILVGHSDGASIAAIFAAAFPERVAGLALEAPHIVVEEETIRGIADARRRYREGPLRDSLTKYHHANTEVMFESWADVWLSAGFRDWSIEADLASVGCPVLVVQGENDSYGTLKQVRLVEGLVRGPVATLVLPGCGHAPHLERTSEVLDAMSRLVASVG